MNLTPQQTPPQDVKLRLTPPIALRFALPKALRKRGLGLFKEDDAALLQRALNQGGAATLLQQAWTILRINNHTQISAARRLRDTESFSAIIWPQAVKVVEHCARDPHGVPESRQQQGFFELLDRVVFGLITAYQLSLVEDANAERPWTAAHSERVQLGAFRVLEWIRLQQRLRALRYRLLAVGIWQITNNLFFALAAEGLDHQPQTALAHDPYLTDAEGKTSIRALYLSIQGLALFDLSCWPRRQQAFVDYYRTQIDDGIRLLNDATEARGPDVRFTHAYYDAPASVIPINRTAAAAVLDCTRLAETIRADQHTLASQRQRSPARLEPLPANQRRAAVRLMVRDLDDGYVLDEPASSGIEVTEARIKVGMQEVRDHLRKVFSRQKLLRERPLSTELFAGPQAAPAEPPRSTWQVIDDSGQHVRLRLTERWQGAPLLIGNLVAYGLGASGMRSPVLGKITRLLLTQDDTLILTLQTVADFGALIRLDSPTVRKDSLLNEQALPCLLVHHQDLGWGIISPHHTRFGEGDAVVVRTKRLMVPARLRNLRDATPEFLLFQIDDPEQRLGTPTYPHARKRNPNTQATNSL